MYLKTIADTATRTLTVNRNLESEICITPPAGSVVGNEISARLWVLNFSDGQHSLLDIADRSGLPFAAISDAAQVLRQAGLLKITAQHELPEDGKMRL